MMTDLDYKELAKADRVELIEQIESRAARIEEQKKLIDASTTAHARTTARLNAELAKPVYFLVSSLHHAEMAAGRLGIAPQRRRVWSTNDTEAMSKLNGMAGLKPTDVYLVRGWEAGKFARDFQRDFEKRHFPLECAAWAPDPHFDFVSDGSYEDKIITEAKHSGLFDLEIGSNITIQGKSFRVSNMQMNLSRDDAARISIEAVGVDGSVRNFAFNYVADEYVPEGKMFAFNPKTIASITNFNALTGLGG